MRILDWNSLVGAAAPIRLAPPRAARCRARRAASARDHRRRAPRRRCRAHRIDASSFDGVRLGRAGRLRRRNSPPPSAALSAAQHAALDAAIAAVHKFHAAQAPAPLRIETAPGVLCERISVPVRAVGLYVPAGSAPLPSTAIMLAVPAAIAGCPVRIMCTAPTRAAAPTPRFWSPRARRASSGSSRWAARKPSPPWPTAPHRYRSATSCSVPATRG